MLHVEIVLKTKQPEAKTSLEWSGVVWTRGFAVEETSGDRKQSDVYGTTLQYWGSVTVEYIR